jgi:sterol desaturase/sphingolipid hydroxylase (fatty acid hydroxylase superfamily)
VLLLSITKTINLLFPWLAFDTIQELIARIPILIQVLVLLFIGDLFQYWIHRAYHEIPFLWRIHAIHHSAERMDWLAGSRIHIVEYFVSRLGVITPIVLL